MLNHSVKTGMKLVRRAKLPVLESQRWAATISADHKVNFDDAALASAKPFEEIPSMLMLPYFGTAWIYLPIIGRYDITRFVDVMKDKRYRLGDFFREKVGPLNLVFTYSPDDMKTLYEHEGPYPSRGETESIKVYRQSRKEWYKSSGLLVLQGKEWHDLRTKTQKHLMKPKAIQAYLDPMQEVARDLVDKILKVRDPNKEVPNFLEELYKWALECEYCPN